MDNLPSAPKYLYKENKTTKRTQDSNPNTNGPLPIRAKDPELRSYADITKRRKSKSTPRTITPLTTGALIRLEVEEWDRARRRQERRPSNLSGGGSGRVNKWVRQIQALHERNELLRPPEHQLMPSTIENYNLVWEPEMRQMGYSTVWRKVSHSTRRREMTRN